MRKLLLIIISGLLLAACTETVIETKPTSFHPDQPNAGECVNKDYDSNQEVLEFWEKIISQKGEYNWLGIFSTCTLSNGNALVSTASFSEGPPAQEIYEISPDLQIVRKSPQEIIQKTGGDIGGATMQIDQNKILLTFSGGDGPYWHLDFYEFDLGSFTTNKLFRRTSQETLSNETKITLTIAPTNTLSEEEINEIINAKLNL